MASSSKEDIESKIRLKSNKIGSKKTELLITENHLLFRGNKINIDNIKSISCFDNKIDKRSIGLLISYMVSGLILSLTLTTNLLYIFIACVLSFIFSFFIIKIIKNKPYASVKIKTSEKEYNLSILTKLGVAHLFAMIAKKTDIELNPDDLPNNGSMLNILQ